MLYEEHNSSHRWVHAPGTVLWPMMCNFSLSFYGDLPANTNCRTENRQFAGIIYPERGRGGVWALVHLLLSMFWEPLHSGLSTGEHRGFNLGSQMHVRQDTKPWCCCSICGHACTLGRGSVASCLVEAPSHRVGLRHLCLQSNDSSVELSWLSGGC